jgi:hypothetical protein
MCEDRKSEPEITPEMIEAGVEALTGYGPGGDGAETAVREIFTRMSEARRSTKIKTGL